MQGISRIGAAVLTLLVLFLGSLTAAGAQELNTLRLDIRKADVKADQFTLYFTLLDADQLAVKEIDPGSLQLLSADNQQPLNMSKPELKLLSDTQHPVAVMFVVANYRAFNEQTTKSRSAIAEFIGKMRPEDLAGVVHYGDTYHYTGLTYEAPRLGESVQAIKDSDDGIPRFFAALSQALRKFEQEGNSQKIDLRYLVIVSDGYGPWVGDKTSKSRDRKIDQTAKRMQELGIIPIVIGYSPTGDPEDQGLTMLRQLAARSKGTFRSPSDGEEMFQALDGAYQEVFNSHVLTFSNTQMEANKTHKVRLVAKVKALEVKSPPAEIAIPKPEGVDLFWWIVGGSACLFLGLVVAIIIGFVVWQRKKKAAAPPEPVYDAPMPVMGAAPAMAMGMVAPAMAPQQYDDSPPPQYFGKFKAVSGSLHGRTFYIVEEQTTIGRVEGNTIMLQDASVSSKHAGVRVRDGNRYELHDFGSTNGVFINGKRIKKQFLKDGDKVRVGDLEFVFTVE
jgi:hypothetical protein